MRTETSCQSLYSPLAPFAPLAPKPHHHHRHRHHLWQILRPTPLHRYRRNHNDYDSSGGCCYWGVVGRATTPAEAGLLRKGVHGGVTKGNDGRRHEASAGPLLPGVGKTGGADRRCGDRCPGRKGKHRTRGSGQEHSSAKGQSPALPEEDRRDYW